jgi:proteasome lid subunit RPN8/RPN11
VRTTQTVLNEIREHGAEGYPEECCGFLLGELQSDSNVVSRILRAHNSRDEHRGRRFTIAPGEMLEAERTAAREGLDVVGFYHSHPDHPARPSETDLREATFPGYTYVIVSIQSGRPGDLTAWSLAADRTRFLGEPVSLIPER